MTEESRSGHIEGLGEELIAKLRNRQKHDPALAQSMERNLLGTIADLLAEQFDMTVVTSGEGFEREDLVVTDLSDEAANRTTSWFEGTFMEDGSKIWARVDHATEPGTGVFGAAQNDQKWASTDDAALPEWVETLVYRALNEPLED